MRAIEPGRDRFGLVTAAHHFVLTFLPLRHPDSRTALAAFVSQIAQSDMVAAELDAILLRVLSILNPSTGGRLPSLIERYLTSERRMTNELKRFEACVEDVLTYRSIGDPWVQQAVAIIERRYSDPRLTQQEVADGVGLAPAHLAVRFKAQTRLTFSEYLRQVRLSRAAALLAQTAKRIKEVWADIGYNYGSNFDHDFKRQFRLAPREYRARAIRPDAVHATSATPKAGQPPRDIAQYSRASVLIVDDDQLSGETIARFLTLEGHTVAVASRGDDGLHEAERCGPDVILLDYHLPDTDGLAWLQQLRSRCPAQSPTVIVFTADWEVERDAADIRALGGTVASKLCDLSEIANLITARELSLVAD